MKPIRIISNYGTLLVTIFFTIFYIGCNEANNPLEPFSDATSFSASPSYNVGSHLMSLPLPESSSSINVESNGLYSETMLIEIESKKEQKFDVNLHYTTTYGTKIKVKSKLYFPPNSFNEETNVTQTIFTDHIEVYIDGELNSDIMPEYDMEISGLDFQGMESGVVEFETENSVGDKDIPLYEKLKLEANKGKIKIEGAKLKYMNKLSVVIHSPNWIAVPFSDQLTPTDGMFSQAELIDGVKGGDIKLSGNYYLPNGREIQYRSELEFLPGAFDGELEITNTIFTKFADATFKPHIPSFNIPAVYNLELKGLDLTGVIPSEVLFVYMDSNGDYELVQCEKIEVEIEKGKMKITGAQLPHFSRFGFVK